MEKKIIKKISDKFEARKPDYKNSGVAVWINNKDEENEYLTIHIIGHNSIIASKNNQKKGNKKIFPDK